MAQDWVRVKGKVAKSNATRSHSENLNWLRIRPKSDNYLELDYVQLPKLRVTACRNFADCGFALAKIVACNAFSLNSNESLEGFGLSCGVLQLSDVHNWAEIVIKGSKPSLNLVRNETAGKLQDFLYFVLGPAILAKWEKIDKDVFVFEPVNFDALQEAISSAVKGSVLSCLILNKNSLVGNYNNCSIEDNNNNNNHNGDGVSSTSPANQDEWPDSTATTTSGEAIEDEELSSDWRRCCTSDGDVFYFNPISRLMKWDADSWAPLGHGVYVESPIRDDGSIKAWVACVTPANESYWYSPAKSLVTWTKPSDLYISESSLEQSRGEKKNGCHLFEGRSVTACLSG
eukprot:Filipodium_phascolosomae@DN667_c0_g1_i1.p1